MTDLPSRVVDRFDQGWHLTGGGGFELKYEADYGRDRGLPSGVQLDWITAERGPWREVVPPTAEEDAAVTAALELAGRKAVLTVAAALEVVVHERRAELIAAGMSVPDSYEPSMRMIVAGREGSWESTLLREVALIGNGHNLVQEKGKDRSDVDAMRAAGPDKRVHVEARDALAGVLRGWTRSPDRYVEVAETLAAMVSGFADERYGADGWRKIADQWLQPDARIPSDETGTCYRLLYSQSRHYDYSVT